MAPRATAACALAALLLALAASDSHASFFGDIFGGSDGAATDGPVVSTESSATMSAGRGRTPKSSRNSQLQSEMTGSPPGQGGSHSRTSGRTSGKTNGKTSGKAGGRSLSRHRPNQSAQHKQLPPPNATIVITAKLPKKTQEETADQEPMETSPSQPPAPSGEQRAPSSIYPPTVITETVRMEDGQLVAHVDVPAEAPQVANDGLRPIASLADLQANALADDQQSVWGPYPTELNSLPFDYTGMEEMSFPYGQNSLPPWWQSRPFTMPRNSWYPMSQVSYHPWRSSRLGLPPMMNPYTQTWLRGRGRRQTMLSDPFEAPDVAEDPASPDPWYGYFGNAYYGYSGWPPYTPPMRMYVPPYAYPWGPYSSRWVSKFCFQPFANNAVGQLPLPSPSPSPSPTHADSQTATGAEQHRKQSGAPHRLHHIRHPKHHMHAPVRLQPPSWLMPQMQHPSWPSVASLPQMLPMRPYMPSPPARASAPAPSASGPAPPPPPAPSADSDEHVPYDD